jgi:hypothetical protein
LVTSSKLAKRAERENISLRPAIQQNKYVQYC